MDDDKLMIVAKDGVRMAAASNLNETKVEIRPISDELTEDLAKCQCDTPDLHKKIIHDNLTAYNERKEARVNERKRKREENTGGDC